ncbi:solute carrier family 2, facilitated glucose transporter member 10-like [Phymastichus coffea]|uniref:solute carrier family 2, facilitated glucose transporter member 10-like n=1 Tax=Phymastichus coffea TaxID=108790 RepID=UPI00273C623B|nr:solute carrier family 2, facilitated glucose transporter member 10-like [Phymastichus coffea]
MSEDEDTTILLNTTNRNSEPLVIKSTIKEYEYIPPKKLRKPIPRHTENLTPLVTENQSVLVSIVATIAGIAFGYDMGIGRQIAPLVKREFGLDCNEENMIVNVWFIGCLLGAIVGGLVIDTCGRRWTMISSLIFLTFGSMLSALANHYVLFLIARIICGYSGTVSAMAHCIYMAEVSNFNKRGCNITLHQVGAAAGLLFAVIATASKDEDYQWRFAVGVTSVPAMFTCITTIIFLQRSPSFLLLKRVVNVPRVPVKNSWCYVFETLIVMMVMLALRQGTGKQQVLFYAPRLFAILGICSNIAKTTSMIALGIVRVFSTILCLIVVERCGRRTALITSATICMTSVSLLSLLATLDRGDELLNFPNEPCTMVSHNNFGNEFFNKMKSISPTDSPPPFPFLPTPLAITAPNTETWTQVKASCEMQNIVTTDGLTGGLKILAVITLLVFESAYALGLGPVPLLTLSEVFPAAIRGKCVGFSVVILWIVHMLLSESIGRMTRAMTLAGTYLFYSFMCLIAILYVFLIYPETKGKSLNRIAQELRKIPLATRICNNMRSLPTICHIEWIINFGEKANQSTPI